MKPHMSSETRANVEKRLRNGDKVKDIARAVGYTERGIRDIRQKLGIETKWKRLTASQEETVKTRLLNGDKIKDIAEDVNACQQTVAKFKNELGIVDPYIEKRKRVRELLIAGETVLKISYDVEISTPSIYKIRKRLQAEGLIAK